jgi:hypothetical protein
MLLTGIFLTPHRFDDVLAIENPHQPIDPRCIRQEFGLMALDQASRHDHPLALPRILEFNRVANLGKRFSLGGFEKPASIDYNRIRLCGIGRDGQPILSEQPKHSLAVHEVLGTAKADEGDGFNLPGHRGGADSSHLRVNVVISGANLVRFEAYEDQAAGAAGAKTSVLQPFVHELSTI